MVEDTEENKPLLIKLGFIKKPEFKAKANVNVITPEDNSEHVNSNPKRTKKRKSAK